MVTIKPSNNYDGQTNPIPTSIIHIQTSHCHQLFALIPVHGPQWGRMRALGPAPHRLPANVNC